MKSSLTTVTQNSSQDMETHSNPLYVSYYKLQMDQIIEFNEFKISILPNVVQFFPPFEAIGLSHLLVLDIWQLLPHVDHEDQTPQLPSIIHLPPEH